MENLTFLPGAETLELEIVETCNDKSHHHLINGYGACTLCECALYFPDPDNAICQTRVDSNPGGICGHTYEYHQD